MPISVKGGLRSSRKAANATMALRARCRTGSEGPFRVPVELDASELQKLKARFEELCRQEPAPPFGEMFDESIRRKIGLYRASCYRAQTDTIKDLKSVYA